MCAPGGKIWEDRGFREYFVHHRPPNSPRSPDLPRKFLLSRTGKRITVLVRLLGPVRHPVGYAASPLIYQTPSKIYDPLSSGKGGGP